MQTYGGVLEHPAHSAAWDRFDLPKPSVREGWTLDLYGGASAYVEQGRYGLPVKKATWLYAMGATLPDLRWGWSSDSEGATEQGDPRGPAAWRDRWRFAHGGRREQWLDAMPDSARLVSGQTRGGRNHIGLTATTPPAFRDVLLDMARSATAPP